MENAITTDQQRAIAIGATRSFLRRDSVNPDALDGKAAYDVFCRLAGYRHFDWFSVSFENPKEQRLFYKEWGERNQSL